MATILLRLNYSMTNKSKEDIASGGGSYSIVEVRIIHNTPFWCVRKEKVAKVRGLVFPLLSACSENRPRHMHKI
jgi:hypothetical protein